MLSQEVLEYVTGAAASNQFANSSLTTAIYKQYLFDINMFTHLNINSNVSFTTGEKITGGTSGATATLESLSTTSSVCYKRYFKLVQVL